MELRERIQEHVGGPLRDDCECDWCAAAFAEREARCPVTRLGAIDANHVCGGCREQRFDGEHCNMNHCPRCVSDDDPCPNVLRAMPDGEQRRSWTALMRGESRELPQFMLDQLDDLTVLAETGDLDAELAQATGTE